MQYCQYRRDNVAFTKKPLKWSAVGIEPSEEKKVQGFGNGEYPAAGHFDFKFHSDYEVIQELQEKAGEVKSINGQLPDEKGNIKVNVDTSNLATKEELKVKYSKPLDGIPKTDLAREVQTSLTKADGSAKQTDLEAVDKKVTEHQADLAHVHWIGTTAGTNILTASYGGITEYKEGLAVSFKNTNPSNGSTTLNINGLGAVTIINSDGEAQSELKANGVYTVRYASGNFMLQGSQGISKATQISGLSATVGFAEPGKIQLDWVNPTDPKLKGVRIMYSTGYYPLSPTDGIVFYDSNDANPTNTYTKQGFVDGTRYYFRAFAWTYKNATRVYTTDTAGARTSAMPMQIQGSYIFTTSSDFIIPFGVTEIDLFLVGGGGSGGYAFNSGSSSSYRGGGGGGGGYTATYKKVKVSSGTKISAVIGAGGSKGTTDGINGGDGGSTLLNVNGVSYEALGGKGGGYNGQGGKGGSGAGSGHYSDGIGGNGGSNGSDGLPGYYPGGLGQNTTTKAFGDTTGTLYAGGGAGGGGYLGSKGTGGAGGGSRTDGQANTGGGGGGNTNGYNRADVGNGGSGVAIIRWGY